MGYGGWKYNLEVEESPKTDGGMKKKTFGQLSNGNTLNKTDEDRIEKKMSLSFEKEVDRPFVKTETNEYIIKNLDKVQFCFTEKLGKGIIWKR